LSVVDRLLYIPSLGINIHDYAPNKGGGAAGAANHKKEFL